MNGGFTSWLERVRSLLRSEHRDLVRVSDPIYTYCLDWFTEGMSPEQAASEVTKFADAPQAAA